MRDAAFGVGIIAVLGCHVFGCGSNDAASELAEHNGAIVEAWAEGACARHLSCWNVEYLVYTSILPRAFVSEASCQAELRPFFRYQVEEQIMASVAEGRVAFHPDRLDACLSALRELECGLTQHRPEACHAAFEGRVALGGTCLHEYDCEPGSHCVGEGCGRTCRAIGAQGASCEADTDCTRGLRCVRPIDLNVQPSAPATGTCEPPVAPGDACFPRNCEDGSWCATSDGRRFECTPVTIDAQVGEACGPNQACAPPLACRGDDENTRTCVEVSEGDPCQGQPDCGVGLVCHCDAQPCSDAACRVGASEGMPCSNDWSPQCARGLHCGTDGLCRTTSAQASGQPCEDGRDCASGRCANGTCARADHCDL